MENKILSTSIVETISPPKRYFRITSVQNNKVDATDIYGNRELLALSEIRLVVDPIKWQELDAIFNPQP